MVRISSCDAAHRRGLAGRSKEELVRSQLIRKAVLTTIVSVFIAFAALNAFTPNDAGRLQLSGTYIPSGTRMYREYCASCHVSTAKASGPLLGPVASSQGDASLVRRITKACDALHCECPGGPSS